MGASNTSHYTEQQILIAGFAKALAHPARVAIVEFLLKQQSCICNDIVDVLPLAQPTVSQHLKELKQAGLIQGNVEGNAICYCINEKAIAGLMNFLTGVIKQMNYPSNCC